MIIKKILLGLLVVLMSSCVTKKIYNDLETKYAALKKESQTISDENEALKNSKNKLENGGQSLSKELENLKAEYKKQKLAYETCRDKFKALEDSHNALERNSNESLEINIKKNRDLLAELEEKAKNLAVKEAELNKSGLRLKELEEMIASKEASMKKLKETLSKALNSFEGKGLTVQQKNGKVYVSVENKLLFNSGSWVLNSEGKKAVEEIGKVLGDNPDISVLIEGHTDDDAFVSSGAIADNWDLSTKRATSIVAILCENKKINKQNLTATGKGEFSPLVSNATPEGKAKNRRIEIILTPRLDAIAEMLDSIN